MAAIRPSRSAALECRWFAALGRIGARGVHVYDNLTAVGVVYVVPQTLQTSLGFCAVIGSCTTEELLCKDGETLSTVASYIMKRYKEYHNSRMWNLAMGVREVLSSLVTLLISKGGGRKATAPLPVVDQDAGSLKHPCP